MPYFLISLLLSLLLTSCRSPGPQTNSAILEDTPLSSGTVDLTTFIIDTPAERRLFQKMTREMDAHGVSYQQLADKVPDLLAQAPSAIRSSYSEENGLTEHEVVAIYFYTTAAYEWLNKPLRIRNTAELAKWESTIQVASSGLNKLPTEPCTVKRGTGLPPDVLAKLQPNARFKERGFLSTTLGRIPKEFRKAIEMGISSPRCRPISWASEYPNEKEVLFPPGSEFKVIERKSCPSGVREICLKLEEIPGTATTEDLATGSEETEPSNGAKGVGQSYRERDFTNKRYVSVGDPAKYIHFATTRSGTWVNTNGENSIADWVLNSDSNIVEIKYRRPGDGNRRTLGYFLVLSDSRLGRLRGPNSDRIDEYYEVQQ